MTSLGEDRGTHTWAQDLSVHLSAAAVLTSGCLRGKQLEYRKANTHCVCSGPFIAARLGFMNRQC